MKKHLPLVLLILDGWGYRESREHNAIASANTPVWDDMWARCPHMCLDASGHAVGLPDGQMGNSEVGHMNIGAGRLIPQDFTRIQQAITDKTFFSNAALLDACAQVKQHDSALHIFGLLSPGGVHSHEQHIAAMLDLAAEQKVERVYVHAFLDGRDTPPQSAKASLERIEQQCQRLGCGQIVSLCGRYYAMDRDQRWDRIEQAYGLLTEARAVATSSDAVTGLQQAYDRGETDEFVKPTSICIDGVDPICIDDNDAVVFMNFRADRARQLTRSFTDKAFNAFTRNKQPKLSTFVTLTEYEAELDVTVAFPPQQHANVLGEVLSNQGLKQLRLAETEKYAHVTFFFNGGVEQPFVGEDRQLIPSPKVATYDLQPEMSAPIVTDTLVEAIKSGEYQVIICNYANADMVGHTGNFSAAVQAIECIDACLGRIKRALAQYGGELLITADHGNADCMQDVENNQPHTAHTTEPVPFVYVGRDINFKQTQGVLADVAPTMLALLGIKQPAEMTGKVLLDI